MQPKLLDKIFVILDKETGQYVSFGNKCAWKSSGYAKNAYKVHTGEHVDSQDKYQVVEVEV